MHSPSSKQPSGFECEVAMLGAFICSTFQRAEVLETCRPEMVEDEKHRIIYSTLSDMFLRSTPIGAYELVVALRSKGLEAQVGGADAILAIVDSCPDINGALRAAEQVREFWTCRRVAAALDDLRRVVVAPGAERLNAAEIMNRLSVALSAQDGGKSIIDAAEKVDEFMTDRPGANTRPGIGIPSFDKSMSLFRPGELTIVAGRPGGGKSSLMRQIIWRASMSGPALVFTLEVTPKTLVQQLCCEAAGVPFEAWRDGKITDEDETKLAMAQSEFEVRKIKIYTKARVAALQVGIGISQLKAESLTPAVIVVDYLGLMDHGKAERNDLAIGQTTRALKLMALEQNVPIVLLCQMNRESEKRGTGSEYDRPRLADLRDSGNIEQDADNIIFIWKRERDDNKCTTQPRVITIAKHRNGHVGDIDLMFDMPRGRFFEMAVQYAG